jgi:hypothetical protein
MRVMDDEDETAHASLQRVIYLPQLDDTRIGWREAVMLELDRMRAEMPYADMLTLRLTCERRADHG